MEPFRPPPPLTTLPPGYPHSGRPEHSGLFMLMLWTVFLTIIVAIYIVLTLVLHLEERNYARRQRQIMERFQEAFPPSPPLPRPEEERDIERSPLLHWDSDGYATEEEGYYPRGGGRGGYGATGSHRPFVPARVHSYHEPAGYHVDGPADPVPSPPYSPGTPNTSYMDSIDAVVELGDNDDALGDAARPRSPSISEAIDNSVVTDSGVAWEHVESVVASGSGLAEEAAAAAEDAVAAEVANDNSAGMEPSQVSEEARSGSSSSNSPDVLGGHEVMTKIRKAVHWPNGVKGTSSSSSSGCSSPKSSQQDGQAEGLRKRSNQES